MSDLGMYADKLIREAMEDGQFANLPGEGRPLNLEDDRHVPQHLRLAHKLLRDNDMAPDWIAESKELDGLREAMLKTLRRNARAYLAGGETETWTRARGVFQQAAVMFNRKVTRHNLKLPPGFAHKTHLNIEREIQRALDAR